MAHCKNCYGELEAANADPFCPECRAAADREAECREDLKGWLLDQFTVNPHSVTPEMYDAYRSGWYAARKRT